MSLMSRFSRARKLLSLIPPANAPSDAEDGKSSSDEEELHRDNDGYISSDPPSIPSSLERMNLLDEDFDQIEDSDPVDHHQLLSPVIREVFPIPGSDHVEIENVPSISSIPSLPSATSTPASRTTRAKRKLTAVVNILRKKRKPAAPIKYIWRKNKFEHKAIINDNDFVFPMNGEDTPVNYFKKYFSDDIFDDIVLNSNLYSIQNTGKTLNLTVDELHDFVSILLIMGIVGMPSYLDYWSNDLRYPAVADTMPLKRFQQIRRNLHFVDNSLADSDRFNKVRPFVEKVRRNCLATEEEMRYSVDEMTIPYKGNKAGNRKQYNPIKPNKWGFKNVVRAGMSGIVYDFILYAGEDTFRYINFTDEEQALTLGAKLVIALCKTIQTPASVVYFDNYFSTLELAKHLRENYGIFSLGTIRQNRLKGADALMPSDKDLKKKGRGSFSQLVDNENKIAIVKWFDNKVVTLISTYADSYPVETIKRYCKEKKEKVNVECPQLVKHYNQHMGGVDLSDMLIALYRTSYKSRRWYTVIFAQMLDICVNNAWLLYRRDCTRKGVQHINLKTFRSKLSKELKLKGRATKKISCNYNARTIQNATKPRPPDSIRYDEIGHWQSFTSQGRCKYCTKNKTDVYCVKCNQRLCFVRKRNCFYQFHHK